MTWLFSLYWLGALAAVGPVVFHMWRRTPRGERAFSTLMFLTPSPPRITSRSRIEHWLLLLLRAAALGLLAFAFTRPLWRAPITEPDNAADQQLIAILVDTSASMRREGLWDDLIQQLDERLTSLPSEAAVALYAFDQRFVPVADFHELKSMELPARNELVRARLKELKPTWNSTRLGEGLVRTALALQDAQSERSKPARQRIWLASDLQSGAGIVALQGYEWPDQLPVELILARPRLPSNAGLQVVERNLESGDDVLRVRVTNSADSVKEQLTLKWETPGSPVMDVYVPPGQSRILLPPKLSAGVVASSLILGGDDHEFDNRVYLAETTPETRLVVYCGPERANDTEGARFYLERVFSASNRFRIEMKDRSEANVASADAQPSLVVLTEPDPDDQPLIRNHLANGGIVVIASPTPEAMAASLTLCGRDGATVTEAEVSKYAMLGEIDFEHPVFAPFAEAQFSDFTGIRFWKHRTIRGLDDQHPPVTSEGSSSLKSPDHVLAKFDDGEPAIIEIAIQRGRLIVFASGWHPADSQFARSSKFPMLMFRLLEQSSGVAPRQGSQSVGSALSWPTTSRAESAATGTARLPDGTELVALPLDQPFEQTGRPGLYALTVPGRTEQIAVNLAADESRTAPLTMEQLESYGLKLKSRERPDAQQRLRDRDRQLRLAELEQSQKLWQLILIAVIVLLLIETFLAGWSGAKQPVARAAMTTTE
jgi:hypothetical protein